MCVSRGGQRTSNSWGAAPTASPNFSPFLNTTKVGICFFRYQKRDGETCQEDTHSPDANLLRDLFVSVNIDLVEVDGCVFFGELFEYGTDDSAWTTPGCPKVKDGDLVLADLMTDWPEGWRSDVSSPEDLKRDSDETNSRSGGIAQER